MITEEESIIITTEINKLENYLTEIKWHSAHQTMKILMKLFYENTHTEEEIMWNDIPEKTFDIIPTKKDCKVLESIMVDIAILFCAFDCANDEERINDTSSQQELEKFFLEEMNMKLLNPLLDKILAFSLILLLNEYKDFSSEKKNAQRIAEKFKFVLECCNKLGESDCNIALHKDCEKNLKEIDTSSLEIGQIIKNYRHLCEMLGQDIKSGKSKKIQLEEFKRYFDFEKSGQKFIITDIYDTPLTKEDKRKLGNNSIYVKYIELILLQHLSRQEGYTRTLTKRNWWELLGMVNKKYNKIAPKQLQRIDYKITSFEINNFYQRCNKKLEQILFSALNNLKNRKLIIWELQTVIVTSDDKRREPHYFLALDEHKKKILQVERHILKNVMNYEKMFQVFCNNKQNEYYRLVNEKLNELYGWSYYFKQIKLIYTPEDVQEVLQKSEIDLQKEILNQKIISALNDNAKEKYDKEIERFNEANRNEMIWGEYKESNNKKKYLPDTYIEAQRILTEELINIGHKENRLILEHFDEFEEDDELNQIFNSFLC